MRRIQNITLAICLIFLVPQIHATAKHGETAKPFTNDVAVSPDHRYVVRRVSAGSDEFGQLQKVQIIERKTGRIALSWVSYWRSLGATWSPDSHYVAINDQVANSGDSLYIVQMTEKRNGKILRNPDDKLLSSVYSRIHPGKMITKEWFWGDTFVSSSLLETRLTYQYAHYESYSYKVLVKIPEIKIVRITKQPEGKRNLTRKN